MRLELFFRSIFEFHALIKFLKEAGVREVNLPNKCKNENVLKYAQALIKEIPQLDICSHFSIKNNYCTNADNTYERFKSFCNEANSVGVREILLVSGSGPKKELCTISCLQRVASDGGLDVNIGVVFNPFLPLDGELEEEERRLVAKIRTGMVSSVWLQAGSDISKLYQGLEFLQRTLAKNIKVKGSFFVPSKVFLDRMKSKPWYGVYLSNDYLSDIQKAEDVAMNIMDIYEQYGIEPLIETPVKSLKDLQRAQSFRKGKRHTGLKPDKVELFKETSYCERSPLQNLGCDDKKTEGFLSWVHTSCSLAPSSAIPSPTENPTRRHISPAKPICIMWFRLDFRLTDNVALSEACKFGSVIPLYVHEKYGDNWSPQGAAAVWMKESIKDLNSSLVEKGSILTLSKAEGIDGLCAVFASIIQETGAKAIFFNRRYETAGKLADTALCSFLCSIGIPVFTFNSYLLYEPHNVGTPTNSMWFGHFATLMPFKRACDELGPPERPLPPPNVVPSPVDFPPSLSLEELELVVLPRNKNGEIIDWTQGILQTWDISERGALHLLHLFLSKGLRYYEAKRSRADLNPNSKLSPYLRFGNVSPRTVHWGWLDLKLPQEITKTFGRRLYWRDLAYYHLHCFPDMMEVPIRKHYLEQRWNYDELWLKAWQKGQTGFPMVDAGMRELWVTGWMQQNVRMISAFFLTEYLNIHWVHGEKWFHDTLVDADVAINAMMWQNAGRSGLDQWNFLIDPTVGSQDPSGSYVRKWIPELQKLPAQYIHKPWIAPPGVLKKAGVVLGKTYPHRIITDLEQALLDTNDAVLCMRKNNLDFNDVDGYDLVELPWGGLTRVFTKRAYRLSSDGVPKHSEGSQISAQTLPNPRTKAKHLQGILQKQNTLSRKQNSVPSIGPKQSAYDRFFKTENI